MGKRRSAPRKDVYVNRYRGRISFGADASAGAYESFNTGLNLGDNRKWDLLWFCVSPAHYDDLGDSADYFGLEAQLLAGTHTAHTEPDDMQCIASNVLFGQLTTSGGQVIQWPLFGNVRSAIPVLSSTLTVAIKATNLAVFNSKEYAYEVGYITKIQGANEATEYLAARGQL